MTDSLRAALAAALGPGYVLGDEMRGGMSRVFVATDTTLDRRVVVKTLGDVPLDGPDADRFRREILLAAGLQHPNIVPLHTAGTTADGTPFYVMPFVAGETLRTRLARGAVPPNEVAALLRDIARALGAAHRRGIVHRDIKPENIFIADGVAVVSDFGVSKAVDAALQGRATATGTAVGTPAYMAPEQASGDASVGARADLYALGLVAWELLAGRHPFEGRAPMAMLVANMQEAVPPIGETVPNVPVVLSEVVDALLQKLPARRPADAESVVATLTTVITPSSAPAATAPTMTPPASAAGPASRRAPWVFGIAVTGIAVVLVAAYLVTRDRSTGAAASTEPGDRWSSVQWADPVTEVRIVGGDSLVRGALDEASALAGLPSSVVDGTVAPPVATAMIARRRGDVLTFETVSGRSITAVQLDAPRAELVDRVTGVLLAAAAPELGPWTLPATRPPRASVVRRFLTFDRLLRSRQGSTSGALEDLQRLAPALVSDSSEWPMGGLLALARLNPTLWPAREQALTVMMARRESLGELEQTLLDVLVAYRRGDGNATRIALGELAQRSGSKEFGRAYATFISESGIAVREAEGLFRRLGPGPGREHLTYYAVVTRIEHLLGNHALELSLAESAIVESGSRVGVRQYRLRALAALGRVADATAETRQLDALPEDTFLSSGWAMRITAQELSAHGHRAAADSLLRDAERWYRRRTASARSARYEVEQAQVLADLGQASEALAIVDAIAPSGGGSERDVLAVRALVRYRLGRVAEGDSLWLRWRASRAVPSGTQQFIERSYRRDTGVFSGDSTLSELRRASLRGDTTAALGTLGGRTIRMPWQVLATLLHSDADFASIRDLPAVRALIAPP